MRKLEGRVALIPGGTKGIGFEIAKAYASEGATVVVASRKQENVDAAVAEIAACGAADGIACDISDAAAAQKMVADVVEKYGKIDVFLNSAGIYPNTPVQDISVEEAQAVFNIDLVGPFFTAQAVTRQMIEQKSGSIIFITSGQALRGVPLMAHYSAAKGGVVALARAMESIAKFSQKDAESYRKFALMAQGGATTIVQGFYSPAPTYGLFASMMDASDEGRELMRFMMLSVQDVINEWFEHPKVRIAFTRWISEIMVNPNTKGTGVMVFVMLGLAHMAPGGGMPIGGSGALSEAMESYILDNGGTVKVHSEVVKIITQNGEAKGVRLASGEEIYGTKMVVANLNPQLIVPRMVDASEVPPAYQMKVDRLKHSFSAFNQSLALNEAPKWTVDDPDLGQAFLAEFAPCDPLEYKHYFNDFLEDGIMAPGVNVHFPLVSVQSVHDPSRAPEGKHICYFYEYAPYNLAQGGAARWDEVREQYAQSMLDFVKPWISNLDSSNIIGHYIQSPLDMERMNPSFVQGDFGGIASYMEQFMGNRPVPGMPNGAYSTPIDNLMICGPSCHPGSGASCGGRAAAVAVLEALGKDMDDVVA